MRCCTSLLSRNVEIDDYPDEEGGGARRGWLRRFSFHESSDSALTDSELGDSYRKFEEFLAPAELGVAFWLVCLFVCLFVLFVCCCCFSKWVFHAFWDKL